MALQQLLLIADVIDLGRCGDIVTVKPGYGRNFLLPQKLALVADKFTLRLQVKLQEERSQQAALDKAAAETLAGILTGREFCINVKVDPEGHMYGSVSANDIVKLLADENIIIEKKNIQLLHPIKIVGTYDLILRLNEDVPSQIVLHVISDVFAQ